MRVESYRDGHPAYSVLLEHDPKVSRQTPNQSSQPAVEDDAEMSNPASDRPDEQALHGSSKSGEMKVGPITPGKFIDAPFSEDPWARKTILSLDGGGIRGYSSLLILKRLMYMIEQIELGYVGEASASDTKASEVQTRIPDAKARACLPEVSGSGDYFSNHLYRSGSKNALRDNRLLSDCVESVKNTFAQDRMVEDFKPHHYFDYIVGTSTGGLSAIMLARLEQNVDQALNHYDTVGNTVFGRPRLLPSIHRAFGHLGRPKYASRRMKKALKEVIESAVPHETTGVHYDACAERLPLRSNPRRCRCVVVSYGGRNTYASHPYLFRSYDHDEPNPETAQDQKAQHLNPQPAHQEPIWFVARATSAAPSYFRPAKLSDGREFLDGGVVENNPSWVAYHEVRQMHRADPELVLSIGTGKPADQVAAPSRRRNLADWMRNIRILTILATNSERRHLDLKSFLDGPGNPTTYYRLNVPYDPARISNMKDIVLDEWEPKPTRTRDVSRPSKTDAADPGLDTKSKIRNLTMDYLSSSEINGNLLDCAWQLVQLRRRRAQTPQWEEFACKFVYRCPEGFCSIGIGALTFRSRDELWDHAVNEHRWIVVNREQLSPACAIGTCRRDGTSLSDDQGFINHLAEVHGITSPVFKTCKEMEAWLDSGRKNQNIPGG